MHELNKPNEYSLGTQLRVSDKHRYSDLDELIDAHIKQMARKVTELTSNDRFKGSQESLDKYLTTWTLANPGKSIYAFGWNSDRKKAGQVVLGFRTNERAPISRWVRQLLIFQLPKSSLTVALILYRMSRSCLKATC